MPTPSPSSRPRARLSFSRGLTGSGLSVGPERTRSWTVFRLARFSSSRIVASSRLAIEVATRQGTVRRDVGHRDVHQDGLRVDRRGDHPLDLDRLDG